MHLIRSGFLVACVLSSIPSLARAQCLQWDNLGLTPATAPNGQVNALIVFDDGTGPALYVGGDFSMAGGVTAHAIARWDGTSFSSVGSGLNAGFGNDAGDVRSLAVHDDGSGPALYASGRFTYASGVPAHFIAKWDGATWSALGTGLQGNSADALAGFDDGTGPALYAGGWFTGAGGQPAQYIAKWDGSSWSPVGPGLSEPVRALAVFDDGSGPALFAGGHSPVWDPKIHRWDGSTWTGIPLTAFANIYALTVFDDGSGPTLYAGGDDSNQNGVSFGGVSAYDGSNWTSLEMDLNFQGRVRTLAAFDDGSGMALYAGGEFDSVGGQAARHAAKWDGADWHALGGGVDGDVLAMTAFGPALHLGGEFLTAAMIHSRRLVAWNGCSEPVDTMCFGDGSVASCPCEQGQTGRGCANSVQSGGAVLAVAGATAPDTISLQVTGLPARALTFFLQGDAVVLGTAFSGAGLRCVGGNLKRLYVHSASGGAVTAPAPGDLSISARSAAMGDPIAPGSLRYYQAHYREPNPEFCPFGDNWNLTNGARIRW